MTALTDNRDSIGHKIRTLSPYSLHQITVTDVAIKPPSWKSMNISNNNCSLLSIVPLIVAYNSIPPHEKENPKSLAGHLVILLQTPSYNPSFVHR